MKVAAQPSRAFDVTWPTLHVDAARTHADLPAAAEQGAYGIAFLLAEALTGYVVIERSRKGTGFDYYLGHDTVYPFENAARMEVSGIVKNPGAVSGRVSRKFKQTNQSAGRLPAYVAVIEFSQPKSVFRKKP